MRRLPVAFRPRVALVALGLSCLALACGRSRRSDGSRAPVESASLAIDVPSHDVGKVVQDEEFRHSFAIRNTGSRAADITAVDPGFRCSVRSHPRRIEAKGQEVLEVSCRPDLYGPFVSSLVVRSSDRSEPLRLELRADVTPLLAWERELVDLTMQFGEERKVEVRLRGARALQARLGLRQPGEPGPKVTLLPAEADEPQGVEVHCRGKRVGTHVGQILASTGLEKPAEVSLSYTCKVLGTLRISPTNPYFNLRVPGEKSVVIEVQSSQPDFAVLDADVVEGPFSASFEKSATGPEYRVKVTVREDRLEADARGTAGKLVVRSNDKTEPNKEIPLVALGKLR